VCSPAAGWDHPDPPGRAVNRAGGIRQPDKVVPRHKRSARTVGNLVELPAHVDAPGRIHGNGADGGQINNIHPAEALSGVVLMSAVGHKSAVVNIVADKVAGHF
jgi:hypothetical protein